MPSNDLRMVLLHVYDCSNEELIQNINFRSGPAMVRPGGSRV